jgi:hypothetical protein
MVKTAMAATGSDSRMAEPKSCHKARKIPKLPNAAEIK